MTINGHRVVRVNNFTIISTGKNENLEISPISSLIKSDTRDRYGKKYFFVISGTNIKTGTLVNIVTEKLGNKNLEKEPSLFSLSNGKEIAVCERRVYKLSNVDGDYFSVGGKPDENGKRREVNLYPRTETRKTAGSIYRVRHFLNNLIDKKKENGVDRRDDLPNPSWEDANHVLKKMENDARFYEDISKRLSKYIREDLIPIPRLVIFAMEKAGYDPDDFFTYGFVWDTGTITNLGRALKTIFNGFVSEWYHPLSLNEEKGYGYNSASESSRREPVLRIAPTPSMQPDRLSKSNLGFRNPVSLPRGGVTVELLDQHIQPMDEYRHRIPGIAVDVNKDDARDSSNLIPGV